MIQKFNKITLPLLALLIFGTDIAFAADCANPDGNEGKQVYNATYQVMQYCNGTEWISMGSGSSENQWLENGTTNNIYYSAGNVGIGTDTPATALHVIGIITAGGAIRLANDNVVLTCAAAGDIRYNSTDKAIEVCDGTAWLAAGIAKFNTVGSVPYVGTDKKLTESANLQWNNATSQLTVGEKILMLGVDGELPIGAKLQLMKLGDISDVNVSGAAANDVLTYNGSAWAVAPLPTYTLDSLSDVAISGASAGQVLSFNGSNWSNSAQLWQTNGGNIYYNNAGNVGIGINAPLVKLHVSGDANVTGNLTVGSLVTPGSLIFSDGSKLSADGANLFWDDTNNRLGIGTVTPTAKLHVNAPGASEGIYSLVTSGTGVYGESTSDGYGVYGTSVSGMGVRGTSTSSAGVQGISDSGYAVHGYTLNGRGIMGSAGSPGGIAGYFKSDSGYGLIVEKGKVGLGVTTPAFDLDVRGSTTATTGTAYINYSNTTGTATGLEVYHTGASGNALTVGSRVAGAGNYIPSLVVLNDGKVGIGTLSPLASSKMQVITGANSSLLVSDTTGATKSDCDTYNSCIRVSGNVHSKIALEGRGGNGFTAGALNMYYDTSTPVPSGIYTNGIKMGIGVGTANANSMVIDTNGNVGIGIADPRNKLHVTGDIGATGWIGAGCEDNCSSDEYYTVIYPQGQIRINSGGSGSVYLTEQTSYNNLTITTPYGYMNLGPANAGYAHFHTDRPYFYFDHSIYVNGSYLIYSSDYRLKKDIEPITENLDKIRKLKPVKFLWKEDSKNRASINDKTKKAYNYGFIAQDVMKVMPDLVGLTGKTGEDMTKFGMKEPDEGFYFLSPEGIISPLVGAVQELASQGDEKDKKIMTLQSDVEMLKQQVQELQAIVKGQGK